MIVFDLQCSCGSQFEGWFESRTEYEKLKSNFLITCPNCGSNEIHKILSPVAIHSGTEKKERTFSSGQEIENTPDLTLQFLRSIQEYVEENFEDVGTQLATESLKIHYGVIESRNIRGVATESEEKMLTEEGIELLKIPMLKKPADSKLN